MPPAPVWRADERDAAARCRRSGTSAGLRSAREARPARQASRTMASTARLQPANSSATSASGARLRRRLSKIFHRDSHESGLRCVSDARAARSAPPARGQQPARDLPVAADPAVPAAHVRAVARRILLVQLHVAQQAGARIAAFQQIVAEDAVLGKAPSERALERIDVVDALADERAFAEQILVHVGNGARVRIDAGLARRTAARSASVGSCATRGEMLTAMTRLRAIAVLAIQRVRHRADELARRIARQLRVGVERDHVPHVSQHLRLADHEREADRRGRRAGRHSTPTSLPRLRS